MRTDSYSGERPVYRPPVPANGELIRTCAEYDAVWVKTKSTVEFANYVLYLKALGLFPSQNNFRLLSALPDEERLI